MKYILVILIFIHGIIHLIGFTKAFNLLKSKLISSSISKFTGSLWFITFILFTISGEALFSNNENWYWPLITASIISTILITQVWKDAKFGIIINVFLLIISLSFLFSTFDSNKTNHEITGIMEYTSNKSIITDKQIINLPQPVKYWLSSSGVINNEKISTVWLKQRAKLKMKPNQKNWKNMVAEQYFNIDNPSFIWYMKMKLLPMITIKAKDSFIDGKGEMQIRLISLFDIVKEKGNKVDEATIQRFLAETIWFPSAALSNYISWAPIDSLSAKATIKYKGTSGSGIFHFNEKGDFIKFSAMRYKDNKPDAQRYEWVIEVKRHSIHNGVKIPTKLEVSWILDEGSWTWLVLDIIDVKYNINTN